MQTIPLKYRSNFTGSINLTLMPPPTAGVYSILAVVKAPKDGVEKWNLAGRLDVLSRTPKTYSVTLVPLVEDQDINEGDVRKKLNNIWNQYGISWEVDVDNEFYVRPDDSNNKDFIDGFTEQDWATAWDEGDEFFSQYTSIQKAINRRYNTYASSKNKYDNTRMYVFILPPDKAPYENQVGDMFSETRLSGVHDFKLGGTVKPLVELIPISAAISGHLGKQWGYLFVDNFGSDDSHYRTLSHELGHGKTELEHTFAGNNTAHRIEKGKTNNLMDYSDGTDLVRFQWEAIHNPAIIGKMFQSDEDGAAEIPSSIRGVLKQIEKIRFGYAFNKEFDFYSGVNYASAIELMPENTLSYAAVIGKLYQSKINPKRDYNSPLPIKKSNDTKEYLYYEFREPSSNKNAVEIKVNPSEKNNLENYVFIDQDTWKAQTSTLIENDNRDLVLERFVCYPEIAYNEFTVEQRIELLKKLASGSMTEMGVVNEETLAIKIIKTTPNSQIAELFSGLEEGSLFKELTDNINNVFGADNYTKFIFELLVKFYSQSDEEIKNRVIDGKVLTWHKHETYTEGDPLTQVRTRIDYSTGFIENGKVYFEGTINQVRPPSQQIYTKELPREEMSAFAVVGIHFSSAPGFLNIPAGEVMPIPAFFFEWINDEHVSRVIIEGSDLAITVVSFTFGVGELMTARNTLRVAMAVVGLAKQAGDICFNTPVIKSKLESVLGDENYMVMHWSKISVVLAMVSIDIKLLDDAPVLFDAFAEAWGHVKQDDVTWQKVQSNLSAQEITSIETFVRIVNEN